MRVTGDGDSGQHPYLWAMAGTPNPSASVIFDGEPQPSGGGRGRRNRVSAPSSPPALPAGPNVQSGVARFASGGAGEGYDYVTIVFSRTFGSADGYVIGLQAEADDVATGVPGVSPSRPSRTIGGFRIIPDAQFSGVVSWRAADPNL